MRNLTVCLIAFAVAFSIFGLAFRSVVSANGKMGQDLASESYEPATGVPGRGGVPAVLDDDLY